MRATILLASALGLALSPTPASAQECAEDAALTRAAARLLANTEPPDPVELRRVAREEGSDVPSVAAQARRDGDAAARRAFVTEARARWAAPLACGEARSDGAALLLVGPAAGGLEPLDGDRLRVRLAAGWREARVELRDHRGETWRSEVRPGDEVGLPGDLEAPVVVQLVATGPEGPRPVAERVLGRGAPRPEPVDSDEPVPTRLARLRGAADVGAVRPNRLLARVAARHAEETCRSGRVAHVGEAGDPVERLAREGIRARHVGETIARAADPSWAWASMLGSPSHRAALTDRRFTDAGVGEAEDEAGHTCLVVLLAAWPRPVPFR